ncbi:MAG: hypothetical protein COV69_03055 [Parcubacteria group bacterium CG11_big_fil_rev_8_21_14_0_20_39_14]|nr:MAG: hypothetical protein COV69_03055 [Parcubacteria group bacterium CG11_big_fil_rev_8_21_14_0_20_39_14]PIS35219.1 MAG: hypothetical protein COT36_03595 [Parcubacteria group bacterium CG08_land_8_20_14_0_20_38_56]
MKLAFSTNAFTSGKYNLVQAINKIADVGYRGVEILADHPLLWPFSITEKEIKEIKNTLEKRNIAISDINAFTCSRYWMEKDWSKKVPKGGGPPGQKFGPCFCDYEKEFRQKRIEYTKKVIDLAVKLGVKDISTCSGYQPLRGTRELAWKNMVESLREAVVYAGKNGVRLNIEYEPALLVGSAKEALAICKEINSPNFGLNFDIGHSFVCDENVPAEIKKLKKYIHTVHIEDIGFDDRGRPVHYHLILGQGKMPLKKIFQAFNEIGYNGWYTVELYTYFKNPIFAAKESIGYFKNF